MRIPKFYSNAINNAGSKEASEKMREGYKAWCNSPITKALKDSLEKQIQVLVEEDENLVGTSTEFIFKSGLISNRAKRKTLRNINKELTY